MKLGLQYLMDLFTTNDCLNGGLLWLQFQLYLTFMKNTHKMFEILLKLFGHSFIASVCLTCMYHIFGKKMPINLIFPVKLKIIKRATMMVYTLSSEKKLQETF
jgi:hypothetical protein